MKPVVIIRKIFKVIALCVLAAVLLLTGTIITLYSPWMQESIRTRLVEKMNSYPGTAMTLDSFSFHFPLRLTMGGLSLVQQNDTIVAASELSASMALLPLLKGEAEVKDLSLSEGRFRMGNPDSAMFMTIAAKEIALRPVKIGLKNMAIDIESGTLYGARVGMVITPDTTTSVSPASDPTEMSIRLGRLALHDFSYTMRLLPTIDSLGATISNGVLSDGLIDLKSQIVNLKEFSGLGLDVAYIAPDSTTIASTPVRYTPHQGQGPKIL